MTDFVYGGPPRFAHQKEALRKMFVTKGVTALLYEPGTGKTAPTIDFMCALALSCHTQAAREARVLVVAPLAAVDTWVLQMSKWASPQITWWAEVLGGVILQKVEALAARGGKPFRKPLYVPRPAPPSFIKTRVQKADATWHWACLRCAETDTPADGWGFSAQVCDEQWTKHLDEHPEYRRKLRPAQDMSDPALHVGLADFWAVGGQERERPVEPAEGPRFIDEVPGQSGAWRPIDRKPRLVVEILNLDAMKQRSERGSKTMADRVLEGIKRFGPDLVVVDEAHLLRSPSSNVSRLLARVERVAPRRIELTGTVMPKGPRDVYAQWRFLAPRVFGPIDADGVRQRATLADFDERFVQWGGFFGKEIVGFKNLDELQRLMTLNSVVALKKDCLDLPPTTDTVVPIALGVREHKAYESMRKELQAEIDDLGATATAENILTQGMRLRQITAGHLPEDGTGRVRTIGTSKVDAVASVVNDSLAEENRVVVFTVFTHETRALAERIGKDRGTKVILIDGSTSAHDRALSRSMFGNTKDFPERIVMVAQISTMSVSVNELVTASNAVFASLPRDRAELEQAKARLDRIGQTGSKVTFWYCLARGTVDDVIYESQVKRTNLERSILEHVQKEGK